jgi:hypothetical protein
MVSLVFLETLKKAHYKMRDAITLARSWAILFGRYSADAGSTAHKSGLGVLSAEIAELATEVDALISMSCVSAPDLQMVRSLREACGQCADELREMAGYLSHAGVGVLAGSRRSPPIDEAGLDSLSECIADCIAAIDKVVAVCIADTIESTDRTLAAKVK